MGPYLLTLICVCAAVGTLAASSSSSLAWRRFKSEHGKVYGPEEDAMRFANFLATKQMIERHNANPNATFKMGLNPMSDWTREERGLIGTKPSETRRHERVGVLSPELAKLLEGPMPEEVDWRKVPNRVSAVKDQGKCNSGYAFVATGLLEGQQAKLNMSGLIPLSVQQLVDCSQADEGCRIGLTPWALDDVIDNDGIESEADYPYESKAGKCRKDKSKYVMTLNTYAYLDDKEKTLKKAVANYGPVAVTISATENFMHYSSGILDDPLCAPGTLTKPHDMLVVGYGTEEKQGDYWIVKNSWGTQWGEKGYIRMKRGIRMCDITEYALVAIV